MTDFYDAGGVKLTAKLDSSDLKKDLNTIIRHLDGLNTQIEKSGKKSGKSFLKGFSKSAEQIEAGIIKGLTATDDAEKSGSNAGTGFAEGFKAETAGLGKNLSTNLGKALGGALKGGAVGLLFDGIAFGINKIGEAIQKNKERQEAYNERMGQYKNIIASAGDFLSEFNGVLNENIDLLGLAQGHVNPVTGEFETLLDTLNRISDEQFEVFFKDNRKQRNDLQEDLDEILEKVQEMAEPIRVFRDIGKLETEADLEGLNRFDANYFRPHIEEADKLRETIQALDSAYKKGGQTLDVYKKANDELFQSEQESFYIDFLTENALASGNTGYADYLRDLREIRDLTEQFKRLDIAEGEEEEFATEVVEQRSQDRKNEEARKERERREDTARREKARKDAEAAKEQERLRRQEAQKIERERLEKLKKAEALLKQAQTPLEEYQARLNALAEMEKDTFFGENGVNAETFSRHRVKALTGLASSTKDYEGAIDELIKLQRVGKISADQFGQAFQDLTDPLEDAAEALKRLQDLSASGLNAAAVTAANRAILNSDDYDSDIEDKRKESLQLAVVDLEKEAAKLEKDLILAELAKEDDTVTDLERRLAVIAATIEQLNAGVDPKQAVINAEEFVKKEEEFERQKDAAKLEGDVKDLFKGGIKAAIDGDFEDYLAGKLESAADSMFDNALDTLLDGLLGAGGPLEGLIGSLFGGGEEGGDLFGSLLGNLFGGGKSGATGEATDALGDFTSGLTAAEGGLGQFGGALGSLFGLGSGITGALGGNSDIGGLLGILPGLFAGFFADGGVVPRGQFAIVGEQGPEIITAGASPLRVTPFNDNMAPASAASLAPDGGGVRAMSYAPINNFYGHTQDDLRRSLDERDRALKTEMPGLMDRHTFNQRRGMA